MEWYSEELCHHGVKGQKWGVRRFQNKDGTLTSEGKKHNRTKEVTLSVLTNNPFSVANAVRGKSKNDKTSKALHKLALVSAASTGNPLAVAKLVKESKQEHSTTKPKNKKASQYIQQGEHQLNNMMMQQQIQQQMQQFANWSMQEATRASINSANMASSLAMTGGMNPFMFGQM